MFNRNLMCLCAAAAAVQAAPVFAEGYGLKAGLWETKQVHMIMNGQDMAPMMAAAGRAGGTRICISAAQAARDRPIVDTKGSCEAAKYERVGDHVAFEFNCTSDGRNMAGKGESTVGSGVIRTKVESVVKDPRGTQTIKMENEMTWLGADCQGVRPRAD